MDTLLDQFQRKFEALRGHVHRVASELEAAQVAAQICTESGAGCVSTAQLPKECQQELERCCAEHDISVLAPPYDHATLPEALDAADVGVSTAEYGIAKTGTLIEITNDDAFRLVSSLPRTHVGIFRASTLVLDLDDSAPLLREAFLATDRDVVVSFLSGPSRTGDIELKLTLGVHGPEIAHAVIIDDVGGNHA